MIPKTGWFSLGITHSLLFFASSACIVSEKLSKNLPHGQFYPLHLIGKILWNMERRLTDWLEGEPSDYYMVRFDWLNRVMNKWYSFQYETNVVFLAELSL